jgi:hypothetical protein
LPVEGGKEEETMKRRSAFIAGLAVVLSVTSIAAAAGWSSADTIREVRVYGSNQILIKPEGAVMDRAGCSSTSHYSTSSTSTVEAREMMLKALMSAMLAGKPVRLYVSGGACSNGGTSGYPIFSRVIVQR